MPEKLDLLVLYKDSRKTIGMLESEIAHLTHELEQSKTLISEYQNWSVMQEKELTRLRSRTLEVRGEEAYKNLRSQIKRCSADRKRLRENIEQLIIRLAATEMKSKT